MTFIDLKRIIKSGFQNFVRNSFVSLSSILIMVVTLSVATLLLLSRTVLTTTIDSLEQKVDITVFFELSASEDSILNLKQEVDAIPEVAQSEYISATQALVDFRERHKDDELTLQALDELGGNPLGAMLNIKAVNPEDYGVIAESLGDEGALSQSSLDIIGKINYYQNQQVIDRLVSLTSGARTLGAVLLIVLTVISVIITLNTIRLTIYSARQEIGVMRLVGAGTKYVRGPFIVEGILYGLVASVATMILFFPITLWLGEKMTVFFGLNLHAYYLSNFFQFFIILLVVGIVLGTISSTIAVRRYLNH
jgi:cell division transport system permease protein